MDKKKKITVLKKILLYYAITRAILIVLMICWNILLPKFPSEYNSVFALFDNEHYLAIASNGYTLQYQYAFFPLVPLLIRYLGKWGFLLLEQLLVIISSYLLYYINRFIFKNKDNYDAVFFWLISPISVFTMMFYTEAIFVFLTLLAYYLYKTKRNYFALGTILGLSVMTRSIGSMLFFALFIFMMIDTFKGKEKFKNVLITYIPATIISCLYPIYLYLKVGNPLYFIDTQAYWLKVHSNIFRVLFDTFRLIDWHGPFIFIFNIFLTIFIFGYVIYIMIKKRNEKKYYDIFVYMIFSMISICSLVKNYSDPLTSYYRYIFGCFPIYFIMDKRPSIVIIVILLSMFVTTLFLSGTYFF